MFIIAVIFLLINSIIFLIMGAVECVYGYIEATQSGLRSTADPRPGGSFLEGLDNFVSVLVSMIFGLGLGQLFLLDEKSDRYVPKDFKVSSLKELKILLWETILVALVIFCTTNLFRSDVKSWDILPFPILILVLSLALLFFKWDRLFRVNQGVTIPDYY
jgi:hypothetical protein